MEEVRGAQGERVRREKASGMGKKAWATRKRKKAQAEAPEMEVEAEAQRHEAQREAERRQRVTDADARREAELVARNAFEPNNVEPEDDDGDVSLASLDGSGSGSGFDYDDSGDDDVTDVYDNEEDAEGEDDDMLDPRLANEGPQFRAPSLSQTYPPPHPPMTFAQRMGQATGSVLRPASPWTFRGLAPAEEDDDEDEDEDEDYL